MFKKILIPLDGSKAAEISLDYISSLNPSEVILLQVAGTPVGVGVYGEFPFPYELVESDKGECLNYLTETAKKIPGVTVSTEVTVNEAADGILSTAEREKCNLIVMTSHGRTGMRRFLMGSVAERVARYANCPVLIVGRQAVNPPDAS
jgi:nucleotide-binding universal stress UspA family protein